MKLRRLARIVAVLLAALTLPACQGPFGKAHTRTAAASRGPAVAAVIENAPQARPQSGLDRAQVVYEMMTEGGITRYLAFFNVDGDSTTLGPIRSARIYFVAIDRTYRLPLAHAGGNVDALKAIGRLGLANLDGLFAARGFFWRISSRRAPHNLYTTLGALKGAVAHLHLKDRPLRLWPEGPPPAGGTPTVRARVVWAANAVYRYATSFTYAGGTYLYHVDGRADVQADGRAVRSEDVVILAAGTRPDPDPYTPGSIAYVLREGRGWLLRGGKRFAIRWRFGGRGFTFHLPSGRPALLAPGRVFVQVVPTPLRLTFDP